MVVGSMRYQAQMRSMHDEKLVGLQQKLAEAQVLWLGSLLPRLLTTPNGSQWLPAAPYDYEHTLLLAASHCFLRAS